MTPLAEVRTEWRGDTPIGAIHGEVDVASAPAVAASLRDLVTNRMTQLVVDLTGTRYLDSAGINLLFALGDELRGRQLALKLVVPPASPVARMLHISGLDHLYPTFATLDEAL